MKLIAMYLPQFHRVKENDEWWGAGFTDWESTKKAIPLFEGHYQPHVPYNDFYYDLSNKNAMMKQSEWMEKYGIDGVCIYHYWFKDGRKILEKPAENLLKWTDIDMPFCFCWANETWARSWAGLRDSVAWINSSVNNKAEHESGILLEQAYGGKNDWIEHFNYLLTFFKDSRYIRVDNKPLLVIYKVKDIDCLDEMLNCWRNLAKEHGFEGLYIIGAHLLTGKENIDAELFHEPIRSRRKYLDQYQSDTPVRLDYDSLWHTILSTGTRRIKTYFGGFCGYDDTPRRGRKGMIVVGGTPEKFENYLCELLAKNSANGNEITFINAWNEWGEGMHLEPDARDGFAYLKAVLKAKSQYKQRIERYKEKTFDTEELLYWQTRSDKFEKYLNCLDDWMSLREQGVEIWDYLLSKGYKEILVYGYGIFCRHLLKELKGKNLVVGIVDRQKSKLDLEYPVYDIEDEWPHSDVMIVTSFFYYDEVIRDCGQKYLGSIFTIQQIVNEIKSLQYGEGK